SRNPDGGPARPAVHADQNDERSGPGHQLCQNFHRERRGDRHLLHPRPRRRQNHRSAPAGHGPGSSPGRDPSAVELTMPRATTPRVAKTGKPLRVPDVTLDPRYIAVRKGVHSELAVPLTVEGTLIGVLNVDSTRRDAFSAEDEELLVAIANHAAKVIHHS